MFVTNWISTTKIQKISEITNFFRHYFLSRTEVWYEHDVLLHDGFPVLEKRKGDALSDDYVAHDCGRPAVGKGHGFLSDLWF